MSTGRNDLDKDTTKAILDLAVREYANEADRQKTLDSKTGPLVGATSASLALIVGNLGTKPPAINATVFYLIVFGAALLLLGADVCFLQALRVRNYRRIALDPWVRYSTMTLDVSNINAKLASSYEHYVAHNDRLNETKSRFQSAGAGLLFAGLALVAVLIPFYLYAAFQAT